MNIAKTKTELRRMLEETSQDVGFVPTMGALHDGHLSLVEASKQRGLYTVASIFVNPTQFNDPKDYEKYPVDTETDLDKLRSVGCDLVFLPSREEIYDGQDDAHYLHAFGHLEDAFEGAYRPGHFRGVGQVVHLLFEAVQPQVAFFGEKDFQQLQVIRALVKKMKADIEIVGLPTVREADGLAMSSRNRRLNDEQRKQSVVLHRALLLAKENLGKQEIGQIKAEVESLFDASSELRLEYFDIIDPDRFEPISTSTSCEHPHAVVAAYAGEVRLIDNMALA
eukprot:TRINITY_DN41001_c0_g1_i1.p1 TRINITY_DN41001_c0_g1~~TRINITY_DN41001_c0_g1_i1.p1  ORF type:complete len:280 (+),score=24.17 TRINITY_DN41001_c0_g1_i1:544-1383(+)